MGNARILGKLFLSMRLFSPSNNETFVNFQDLIKRQSKMGGEKRTELLMWLSNFGALQSHQQSWLLIPCLLACLIAYDHSPDSLIEA